MWKLVVGFAVFAAIALFVIFKAGDKVDMGGEKHGVEEAHAPAVAASMPATPASASGPVPNASAAALAASGTKP